MFCEHLLDVGRAASAAVSGSRSRLLRDGGERACALADRTLDRLVFDVVAPANGLQTANGRMQIGGIIHLLGRLTHAYRVRFPKTDLPGRPTFGFGGFGVTAAEDVGRPSFGSLRDSENAPLADRGFRILGFFKCARSVHALR